MLWHALFDLCVVIVINGIDNIAAVYVVHSATTVYAYVVYAYVVQGMG